MAPSSLTATPQRRDFEVESPDFNATESSARRETRWPGALRARLLLFALSVSLVPQLYAQDAAPSSGYHDATALRQRLRALAAARPDIVSIVEIGRSVEGRVIEALLLSDSSGPKAADKPALLVLGNLAGDEAAGGEAVLRIADFVVSAVEKEPAFRALVLKRSVWLIPRPNPDATERLFATPALIQREAIEPQDEDGDGELDEDGPDDLNGDGRISRMRVADEDGPWLPDESAPGLMRLARKNKGERGRYRLLDEGLDKDRDGKVNDDGLGGTDLDQNFPIEYLDRGSSPKAGSYALSAPESRAIAEFLIARPNIGLVIHTHCNAHGPLSSGLQAVPADDQESYELLRRLYKDSDRADDGSPRPDPIEAFATPGGARLHGSFQDFAYHGLGIVAWPARLWQEPPGSWERPEDRDESPELKRARAWQRFFKEKGGLDEWRAVVHPEFGAVELGGLRPFTLTTPPGS
jgi:hypothetical protein